MKEEIRDCTQPHVVSGITKTPYNNRQFTSLNPCTLKHQPHGGMPLRFVALYSTTSTVVIHAMIMQHSGSATDYLTLENPSPPSKDKTKHTSQPLRQGEEKKTVPLIIAHQRTYRRPSTGTREWRVEDEAESSKGQQHCTGKVRQRQNNDVGNPELPQSAAQNRPRFRNFAESQRLREPSTELKRKKEHRQELAALPQSLQ